MTIDDPAGAAGAAGAGAAYRLPHYRADPPDLHPPLDFAGYASTALRSPRRQPVPLPQRLTEVTGPVLGDERVGPTDPDLTRQRDGDPIGQRIIVHGRILDGDGRPVPHTLVEIWQANAAGRYRHDRDRWDAPLDPAFDGVGRTVTDAQGHYRFVTIEPGAYPFRNHLDAWRPRHIHFSLFGRAFTQRLVTQMYFPGDPLHATDPIMTSIPDERARQRLVSRHDPDVTVDFWALAYQFDVVLRGRDATPFEDDDEEEDEL